jgi:hypothetical protein
MKAMLLAQCELLIQTLKEEKVDLSNIPKIDDKSSLNTVTAVLKMLRNKNNLRRSINIGEDMMLLAASGLESVFDGKTSYMGFYPALTGWTDSLRPRMRRMRADTAEVVTNAMNGFNVGPLGRMALEILPHAVLYSRDNAGQQEKGKMSDSEYRQTLHHIETMTPK